MIIVNNEIDYIKEDNKVEKNKLAKFRAEVEIYHEENDKNIIKIRDDITEINRIIIIIRNDISDIFDKINVINIEIINIKDEIKKI